LEAASGSALALELALPWVWPYHLVLEWALESL
jgi:hypothetical protein